MSQFPSAVRLNTTTMPGEDIRNSPLQCILLTAWQAYANELMDRKCKWNISWYSSILKPKCWLSHVLLSSSQHALVAELPSTLLWSSIPQWSKPDIQCFTVRPVLEIPPRLKNKPVPDQIIKSVHSTLSSLYSQKVNMDICEIDIENHFSYFMFQYFYCI